MKKLIIVFVIILKFSNTYCHDFSWLTWRSLYIQSNYDNKKNKAIGIEYNRSIAVLNYSLIYQNWYQNVTLRQENEFSGYIGLGFVNYFQVQYGYSNTNISRLRFKTCFMVKDFVKSSYIDSYKAWWEQISISFFYDNLFSNSRDYIYGFQIGYSFNTEWGPKIKSFDSYWNIF